MGTVPALSQLSRLSVRQMPEKPLFGAHRLLTDETAVLVIYSTITQCFQMSKTCGLEQLHFSGIFVDLVVLVCASWNFGARRR